MKRISFFSYVVLSLVLGLGLTSTLQAQFPPKDEDQLIRQKVVVAIPLNEKMNQPLIFRELLQYTPNPTRYPERNGIIESLLMGLKLAKYTGFHGDSLDWSNTTFTWSELLAKHNKLNDIGLGEDEFGDSEGESGFEDFGGEEGMDDFGGGEEEGGDAIAGDTYSGNRLGIDIGPYTDKMEIIEDRIFDKKRSDMYYDVKWLRLKWVDPGGARPEESFIAFKYLDVMNQLDETQWKNRNNDAEYRSMREVIELRMYHSFIIDVSGNESVLTLNDAEYRRNQLVEYEHHLWHY